MPRDKITLNEAVNQLASTEIPRSWVQNSQGTWRLDKGAPRNSIAEIYHPESSYTLLRTIVNQEAIEVLPKYIGKREGFSSEWEIRERVDGDNDEIVPGANSKGNVLYFKKSLLQTYHRILNQLTEENLGNDFYASYKMVPFNDEGNYGMPQGMISMPTIHVIRHTDKNDTIHSTNTFRKIAENLNSDEAYESIKKIEAPCNYMIGEVDTLRKLGIEPLVIEPREWQVDAKELRQAIDFLVPINFKYEGRQTYNIYDD